MANVGRLEEPSRVLLHEIVLSTGRGGAPQVRKAICVMAFEPGVHEARLATNEEARSTVAETLGGLRERQADLPQPAESLLTELRACRRRHAGIKAGDGPMCPSA